MNLTGLLTGIGQAGSDIAQGKLDAQQLKLKELFDKIDLQKSELELKKLQGNPELEKITQAKEAFKSVFNREPSEDELKILMGFPAQKPAPANPVKTPFELYLAKNPNATYDDWVADSRKEKEVTPLKPKSTVTYDPSGHLRTAWVDPSSGMVSAWGPLAESKSGVYHYKDEETGNIYEVPTFKPKIDPGEVRMTKEAQAVWDNELHGRDTYPTKPVKNPKGTAKSSSSGTPPASGNQGRIVGHTLPKDEENFKKSVQDAKDAYTNYINAQENILTGGSKGQLALVINAAKAQVAGAGRLTNAEIQNEISFGSYGEKFKRSMTMALDGKLTQKDQDELLNVIRNNWTSKAAPAKERWGAFYREKKAPSFLEVPTENKGTPPPGATVITLDDFLKGPH